MSERVADGPIVASPYLAPDEAADYLGISRDTLDRTVKRCKSLDMPGCPKGAVLRIGSGNRRKHLRFHRDHLGPWFAAAYEATRDKRRK